MLSDDKLSEQLARLPAAPVDPEAALATVVHRTRRRRRRRQLTAAASLCVAVAAIGTTAGLLGPVTGGGPAGGGEATDGASAPPAKTAWFRPTYIPAGFARNAAGEYPATTPGGAMAPQAQSFRKAAPAGSDDGDQDVTVSINPTLERVDVDREARTYPVVRVVSVHGRRALLFPNSPQRFHSGVTWQERDGLVLQVVGQNLDDADLLRVADGLEVDDANGQPHLRTTWLPAGFRQSSVDAGESGLPWELVLPRSYVQTLLASAASESAIERRISITETRGQAGTLTPTPSPAPVEVTVHGYPAELAHDTANHSLKVVWSEPGGIRMEVFATDTIGQRELLKVAEGLRQP